MTMDVPWRVTRHTLGGSPSAVVFVETMEETWLDSLCDSLPVCNTVVGVGGGMAIDAAKYVSLRRGFDWSA
jgi:glycerol dehydrogenase-like iron-containing ADH family enzyme